MQTRVTTSSYYDRPGRKWFPADEKCHAFGVLSLGEVAEVHLYEPAEIDAIIAELVALRAEMTGEAAVEYRATSTKPTARCMQPGDHGPNLDGAVLDCDDAAHHQPEPEAAAALAEPRCDCVADAPAEPNPPYHMTGNMIGPVCAARDSGYICNAQRGHDGPQHVAYGEGNQECHRWPVACGARPYPAGSEGDDGTECALPAGHDGAHDDNPAFGGAWCPAATDMEDFGATLYCDREAGHFGSHHAAGPDEGSEVAWSDEAAASVSA